MEGVTVRAPGREAAGVGSCVSPDAGPNGTGQARGVRESSATLRPPALGH